MRGLHCTPNNTRGFEWIR